ncbi:M23 family metallopeptidase [Leifsonia sp. 2TAF2]|uniref:M23 family metallopeptidase n=1 Tax=Leifsonia sp. 2TAF2 TaxID=3233009 RepID=UPI003F9C7A3C
MAAWLEIEYPFRGRWLVQNSPADRVPSHGTALFASAYAIDFVPVDATGRTTPLTLGSLVRPEPPERFRGFGRELLAPVGGIVTRTHDAEPDHLAYRGVSSISYALTQRRRVQAGWAALAGNHVFIETDGILIALCHLQRGSLTARSGQRVHVGDAIARCGNSGNSTEPHVHVQAIDDPDVRRANAVRLTFAGSIPHNGDVIDAGV